MPNQILATLSKPLEYYRRWQYRNTALLVGSIAVFALLAGTPAARTALELTSSFGYLGAFIAGAFFVSVFTIAPASLILFQIAETHNHFHVALAAGLGAVLGDYVVLRLFTDTVFREIAPIFKVLHTSRFGAFFRTPYFAWLMPFIGAFIIASPLPDELGVGVLGLTYLSRWQFLLVAFVLNAVGIFFIITAARL
ncbi:MAG: hypothetical protein ACOYBJ_02275 [Patescibacteria group bacterium]